MPFMKKSLTHLPKQKPTELMLITNIIKHSKAQNVEVNISKDDDIVKNDGVGFDAGRVGTEIHKNEGLGLFNIRERLHHIGGSLEIESKQGNGTRLALKLH